SGATLTPASRTVVRRRFRGSSPEVPAAFISRSTRLRPTRIPCSIRTKEDVSYDEIRMIAGQIEIATRPLSPAATRLQRARARRRRLGFSVLGRSPVSQTPVARHLHQVEADFGPADDDSWEELSKAPRTEAEREIAHAEGVGLRSYLLAHGHLPPWNRIG